MPLERKFGRSWNVYDAFQLPLQALSARRRVAFACAAVEHGLPIFEYRYHRSRPRNALAVAWRFALGGLVDAREIEAADEACHQHIPMLDDPGSFTGAVNAAIGVVEALDSISDMSAGAACRAAAAPLDAIYIEYEAGGLAEHKGLAGRIDPYDNSTAPSMITEEQTLLVDTLDRLCTAADDFITREFVAIQKKRGAAVLRMLLS